MKGVSVKVTPICACCQKRQASHFLCPQCSNITGGIIDTLSSALVHLVEYVEARSSDPRDAEALQQTYRAMRDAGMSDYLNDRQARREGGTQ